MTGLGRSQSPGIAKAFRPSTALRPPAGPRGFGEMSQLENPTNPSNIALLYAARAVRGFGDGFAIIILPAYLTLIGYDPVQIGIVATASLLGTALLTLGIDAVAARHDLRTLLLLGAGLM